jgi:hypothetical protein
MYLLLIQITQKVCLKNLITSVRLLWSEIFLDQKLIDWGETGVDIQQSPFIPAISQNRRLLPVTKYWNLTCTLFLKKARLKNRWIIKEKVSQDSTCVFISKLAHPATDCEGFVEIYIFVYKVLTLFSRHSWALYSGALAAVPLRWWNFLLKYNFFCIC